MAGVISASTVFAGIGAASSLAGTATSALGSVKGGQAAAGQAREQGAMNAYQAEIARRNAAIAEQAAQRAEVTAGISAENKSREGAARLGKVKAAQASNGIDVNTGTAVDVQTGQRELGQLDTETVFNNELLKAYGYRVQGQNFDAEAALLDARAKGAGQRASDAETAGYLKGAGTLLSNASALPLKFGNFGSSGSSGYTGTTQGSGGDYGASI